MEAFQPLKRSGLFLIVGKQSAFGRGRGNWDLSRHAFQRGRGTRPRALGKRRGAARGRRGSRLTGTRRALFHGATGASKSFEIHDERLTRSLKASRFSLCPPYFCSPFPPPSAPLRFSLRRERSAKIFAEARAPFEIFSGSLKRDGEMRRDFSGTPGHERRRPRHKDCSIFDHRYRAPPARPRGGREDAFILLARCSYCKRNNFSDTGAVSINMNLSSPSAISGWRGRSTLVYPCLKRIQTFLWQLARCL